MVSSRSWRSIVNTINSPFCDDDLQQGDHLRLSRTAMPTETINGQRATSDGAHMIVSATNGIDTETAVHMMNIGHQMQQQQHANSFIMQQQQQQQTYNHQGSSSQSAAAAARRYQSAATAAIMVGGAAQQNIGGRRMAPSNTPSHRHGMKDVPYWLKTLRLHKYTQMFSDMEYSQMMSLNEHELEMRGVTKGARRKILQSIAKLRQRAVNVRRLEATFDVVELACLRCAIVELRQLVATPILAYVPAPGRRETEEEIDGVCAIHTIPDENLPALMVRLLMRVYAMGVAGDAPHEQLRPELLLMYFTICDRMLMNEAFTSSQKRRIVQWRRAARRFAAPADLRRVVLPHPPPPRCDACSPVSTFYFNDSLEEIMRVQNLQRLVKQYLNSDVATPLLPQQSQAALSAAYFEQQAVHAAAMQAATAAAARSQLQRDAAICGFSATAAYAARPSALTRKMLPRGGPVSTPPASFYAPSAPSQPQQQQHQHIQSCAGRCCPSAAAAVAAAYQQQAAAAALRMAAAKAAATAATTPTVAPWGLEGVYSSADVFELARPLDLDFTTAPASRSIWSNTPASSSSDSSATSGYSSGSSERGSGAGSPRTGENTGKAAVLRSPDVTPTTPFVAPALPSLVFDFSRNDEDSSLDAACRQIQEQLSFHH